MSINETSTGKSSRISLSLDYRIIILALLAIIVGMLIAWRPWSTAVASDRTISVTGEATIKAEPDEYAFFPSYEFKNKDKDAALDAASKKQDELVKKLKELGVADKEIKTNANGYKDFYYARPESDDLVYNLTITVTVNSRELAQKVQDYLGTTGPTGAVTPQSTFSEAKRKELEGKARDEATKDARAKAEQSAKNLGFKIGKVKSVDDGSGFNGGPISYGRDVIAMESSIKPTGSFSVQPGENELAYSVTVVYYVR